MRTRRVCDIEIDRNCRSDGRIYTLYLSNTVLPRCYALLAVTPPPPPYFRAKLLYKVIWPPLHAPPPRGARAGPYTVRYCSSCTCTHVANVEELYLCIKRVENSLRTGLGLFRWSRTVSWVRHPAVAASGRSLATRLPAMFCNMYVANNSTILQYCHGMSIEGVLVFYHTTEYANSWEGGGGLTVRWKRKSSLLPPPPFTWK